ncbi:NCS2 family nucleobase:cation symporter [Mycoplasmatota bacterium]|nr:NCS2 family nucleobase:cation symporter [Mycoplasmatota bacterium]
MRKSDLIYDVHEKPGYGKWIILSLQHVLAMFGATVLVPILTGLPISVTLVSAGIGTLIYILLTKGKSPVFLGSSFAYIAPIMSASVIGFGLSNENVQNYLKHKVQLSDLGLTSSDLNLFAVTVGLVSVGITYLIVALIIRFVGTNWINKILPPIVIGPTIMVIGLSLAGVAVKMLSENGQGTSDWRYIVVGLSALLTAILVANYTKGVLQLIPIMSGIVVGYIVGVLFGIVDFSQVYDAEWIEIPQFVWLNKTAYSRFEMSQILDIVILMVPVALVTISEHIGDHLVLSTIIGKDLTKNPGLARTLAGDGLATLTAGLLGGPANTTYGENTGVVGITKVASVWVIGGAAIVALVLGFVGKFTALISTVPACVMGGVSMMLFGVIASSGVRVLINNRIDFSKQRNLIIAAVILVSGVGGLSISIGKVTFTGMALSAIIGIILHQILPEKEAAYGPKNQG